MKIIVWNCQMAFRKKATAILPKQPDLMIVPECEHPDKINLKKNIPIVTDSVWIGDNLHKGLAVFSFGKYKLKILDSYNPLFKNILPVKVSITKTKYFYLLAIWANNSTDPDGPYVTQVCKAIDYYSDIMQEKKVILAGDFNSNSIWDKPRRKYNHSSMVETLKQYQISSTYHQYFNEKHGEESLPSFYLYRHKDKPYHLDYCFASNYFTKKLTNVSMGSHETWSKYSDHSPLTSNFNW